MSNRIPLVPPCPSCGAGLPYVGAAHTPAAGCPLAQGGVPSDPVEYAVFEAYASHPSLFGRSPWSRWYIFEHLFFVTGCGHEWLGGKLVNVCREAPRSRVPIVLDARGELSKHREWAASHLPSPYAERAETEELAAIERSWKRFERPPQRYYPLSEHANILQVPADAEPSWLLAACDATRMFLLGRPEGQSMRRILELLQVQATLFARLGLPLPDLDDPRTTGEILAKSETVAALVEHAAGSIALYLDNPGDARDLSPLLIARQQLALALEMSREQERLLGSVVEAFSGPTASRPSRLETLWPRLARWVGRS